MPKKEKKLSVKENELSFRETAKIWQGALEKLTHFFVNQLTPLNTKHMFLKKITPNLLEGYQLAVKNKLIKEDLEPQLLDALESITNIEVHTKPMFDVLQTLCFISDNLLANKSTERFSAKESITYVLNTYPFNNQERDKIDVQIINDFNFCFPRVFLESTLRYWLDMALKHFSTSSQNQVSLSIEEKEQSSKIRFIVFSKNLDTPAVLVFLDNYLATQNDKMTPGVMLCRLLLLYNGGNITYALNKGESLELTILFPPY